MRERVRDVKILFGIAFGPVCPCWYILELHLDVIYVCLFVGFWYATTDQSESNILERCEMAGRYVQRYYFFP